MPVAIIAAFAATAAATVLSLILTVRAGIRGERRRHYVFVAVSLVLVAAAITLAEVLGRSFQFDPLRLRVHLVCATLSLLSLPAVAASGLVLRKRPSVRRIHRGLVIAFGVLTGLAVLTSVWMFGSATPVAL